MTPLSATKPFLIPITLALLVLIVVGYVLFSGLMSSRTQHIASPPIDVIDHQPPLTVIAPTPTLSSEELIEQEANAFVAALAPSQPGTAITITEDNDKFVHHSDIISLPDLENRITTLEQLLADPDLSADTELTLHYTEKEHITTTLAELANTIEDHTVPITIITNDGTQLNSPLAELLNQQKSDLSATLTYIKETKLSKQLTVSELAQSGIALQQPLLATLHQGTQQFAIKDIIQSNELLDNALFYLHRVSARDHQGLWGIIQAGLIDKFRQGLSIEGISRNKDLLQVTIPADADEPLTSGFSSFLGRMLNTKVTSSYIYNFSNHTMSHDPNIIHPGQQLILIHFSSDQLKQIYQFFSAKRNQGIEIFALPD